MRVVEGVWHCIDMCTRHLSLYAAALFGLYTDVQKDRCRVSPGWGCLKRSLKRSRDWRIISDASSTQVPIHGID